MKIKTTKKTTEDDFIGIQVTLSGTIYESSQADFENLFSTPLKLLNALLQILKLIL